jgi:hydrogenase-4 component B
MTPNCLLSPALFLKLALCGYLAGIVAGLVGARRPVFSNLAGFGAAAAASLCGIWSVLLLLSGAGGAGPVAFDMWPSFVPYVRLAIRLDATGAFFLLVLSLLGLALSVYSFGYARAFYGRKSVGVLAAFYNALLLSTAAVFSSGNAFFFLIAWEIMALTAYCLVSFEHEKPEARKAGVLYFVMSHIGTGCLILGFLVLFAASGDYSFESFRGIGTKL